MQTYEAILTPGLESVAKAELASALGPRVDILPAVASGSVRFQYPGHARDLLAIGTVLAISLVRQYPVPRPRALLGDQHLRALLSDIAAVRSLFPAGAFKTFQVSAAGAGSPVMMRLKETLSGHTGLAAQTPGDLQIRLRHSAGPGEAASGPDGQAAGWETLTRLSPRPLAARAWRVCNREGGLDASVARAMVLLTEPANNDIFVNLCCGSGTILIERLAVRPAQRAVGCDIDPEALLCATKNASAGNRIPVVPEASSLRSPQIELAAWDARTTPLADGTVDALCADLPFGTQVGSHAQNISLYPAILAEAARIARPGALFCVLTGELRLVSELLERSAHWRSERTFRIQLAGLIPGLFVLRRLEDRSILAR